MSGAVPPPNARPLGGLLGSATHVLWARVYGCGVQHCPLGLHALWGLRAAGVVGGCPRGGCLATVVRGSGVRRCPSPGRPSSGAGSRGSATRVSRVRSVRAWGPSTRPTACALAGRPCSVWGWRKGNPGGGCLRPLCGASEVRRCPSPNCPPTGRAVGVRHPRAVGAGVWVSGPNTVPLACMPCGGCVPWGWWGGVPGGDGLPPL